MNDNKNKLSGEAINLVDLNYFLYGCADHDFPQAKYMDSPSEQFFRDKVNLRRKGTGKIIIISTPAESGNEAHEFYKLWAKDKQ